MRGWSTSVQRLQLRLRTPESLRTSEGLTTFDLLRLNNRPLERIWCSTINCKHLFLINIALVLGAAGDHAMCSVEDNFLWACEIDR